jgi:hypothetical protein
MIVAMVMANMVGVETTKLLIIGFNFNSQSRLVQPALFF